jgi:hypothetical protein
VFDNGCEVPGDRTKLKSQDVSVNDANEKQEIRSNRQRCARAHHAYDLRGPFSASIDSQCGPKFKVDRFGWSQRDMGFGQKTDQRPDWAKDRRRAGLKVNGTHRGF